MSKIGIDISDETIATLRDYTLKKYGKFRGQSLVVEDALKEYFARNKIGESKGNDKALCSA